ncbi:MAG: glycosyltransferase [Acidobacteria bacterium]|nr:glycosyltransferase [Acidobacteriota bacterium]
MKILYVAPLSPNNSSEYRLRALRRIGADVVTLDADNYITKHPFLRKIEFRASIGPNVSRYNRDVLRMAEECKPDVMWADKQLWMRPSTLDALRERGILTASYMIDNFFGPRRDPGWRLYAKDIPLYDLHITQRDANVRDYLDAGARHALKIQTAYEPTIHFAPPEGWSDKDRNRGVSFLGTPYDNRAEILTWLAKEEGFPVIISGNPNQWRRALNLEAFTSLYREGELYQQQYREAIWRSKINVSFLTHSNRDEFVHKSFEIAACGGFLLAERTQGHMDRFVEDEEAVFFTGYDELRDKIARYLHDEPARARIAAAGHRRAVTSGYDNDTQVRRILEKLQQIRNEGSAA